MEPMPAMPVHPRAHDIAMYNELADRNVQPHWGAAAPKAAAKPRPKRRGRPGLPLPQQPAHGEVAEGEGGGWKRGTFWVNRTQYARKVSGALRKLRTFNSRTGDYKWFPAGRDY